MPKRPSKIDPLDIEELFRSPSLEGMLSFRDVDPATATLRLNAKKALEETELPAAADPPIIGGPMQAESSMPIGVTPTGVKASGTITGHSAPTAETVPGTEATSNPGICFTPIGVKGVGLTAAEILAEVHDASRTGRGVRQIIRAVTVEDGHSGNENVLYWHLWKSGRHVRNSESRFVQMGYAAISKAAGLDRTNVQNILRTLEAKLAIRVVTAGTVKSSTLYEVFSSERILKQRGVAGFLWVQRYGSRRADFVDQNGNVVTPVGAAPSATTPTGADAVPV